MARESKWYIAAFAVAGLLVSALAWQRGRQNSDKPFPPLSDSRDAGIDMDEEAAAPAALETLTEDVLTARAIEIFPVFYLTLMAIIQGAALGVLILTIYSENFFGHGWSLHALLALSQSLAVGLAAVIVTHEYLLLTVAVRWVATIFDTLIPFLLGTGEIWMATAIGHGTSWWLSTSSLCGVAAFAFWHTKIRTVPRAFGERRHIYEQNRKYLTAQTILSVVMLLVSAATALLNYHHAWPVLLNIGMTWGVSLTGVSILMLGARNQTELYDEYRIPRWHPRTHRAGHRAARLHLAAYFRSSSQ